MEKDDLGDVIAMRELSLVEGDAVPKTVLVKLGKPRQFPDASSYYVPFQITGIGSEKVRRAGGVDAIQAIQLAMKMIGATLDKLNQDVGGSIRWEAGGVGDLGFS